MIIEDPDTCSVLLITQFYIWQHIKSLIFIFMPYILQAKSFQDIKALFERRFEMGTIIVLLIIIGLLILIGIGFYNSLIVLRNRCDNAWAQVDVQLRRRYDLIPNLVETVKGYAKHEREVFEKVTEARTKAINAQTVREQGQAENLLTGALKSLFAVVENYPELKANQNFLLLQEELAGTESKIAYARQFYNDSVMKFNMKQQVFPSNIIANMFSFKEKDYFEIEEPEARGPVKVSF
jgi:LemA protein